jgi:hypothetical protein
MGKSDANQTKKRSHKAKATDGEIKHKNKPSFDAMTLEAIDNDGGLRHSQWQDLFRQLCEYKVQFGDCLVPRGYPTNLKLGIWVNRQRNRYKDNTEEKSTSMTAEHIRALNGIGFDWRTSQTKWSVRFQQLCEFKEQFGHCLVPKRYSANPKLGNWVSVQRRNYRLYQDEKPSYMTGKRMRELESVGFKWETGAFIWSVRFQHLCEFKVKFGHCLVPARHAANPKLGKWVSKQRSQYRLYQEGKHSQLTEERIRELESVEFK